MSAIGSATVSPSSSAPISAPEDVKKNDKTTETSQAGTTQEPAHSSEQNGADKVGEKKMEGSMKEAQVRADLNKPQQSAGPANGSASAATLKSADIDGQGLVSRNYDATKSIDVKSDPGFKGLPKATQDKLLKDIQKNPGEANKLQKVLNHPTYDQLSGEQKTKMLNVFTNCIPEGRENLLPLMSRKVVVGSGDPPPTAPALLTEDNTKDHKNLLDHLDTVASQKLAPEFNGRRGELLGRLVQETGRPSLTINQGNVGTCASTTIQMHLLQHSPAEYARIIGGLSSPERSVTLADGSKMDAAQNQANRFLKSGPDPRNVTERMFQGAVQQYGDRMPENMGGRGVNYKYDANNPSNVGMWDHQTGKVMKSLYNRDFAYQPQGANGSRGIVGAESDPKKQDKMRNDLYNDVNREISSRQGPVATHLVWGGTDPSGNPHGLHEVLVEKIEGGRVYFRNPWGSKRSQGDGYTDGTDMTSPARRVEDSREGLESMKEEDFRKLLNGATIGPPVGGA